jgi:hypothetical protein
MRDFETEIDRSRDAAAEQREREAFVLLLHTFNVSDARPDREVAVSRLARELAFEPRRLEELVSYLVDVAYLSRSSTGYVTVTGKGLHYLERAAQHRRSVRRPRPARALRFRR